ncbi:MAG: DUF4234 domain-containing protein [Actinomycetota bacterium]
MSTQPSYAQQALAEIQRRDETDYLFNWPTYFGWNILTLGLVYTHVATYRLIARRREHVARRLRLFSYLWYALAERADEVGRRAEVQEGLDNLARIHTQIESYEKAHAQDPKMWAIIRAIVRIGYVLAVVWISSRVDESGDIPDATSFDQIVAIVFFVCAFGSIAVGTFINNFLHNDFRFLDAWERSYGENVLWVFGRLGPDLPTPSPTPSGREAVPKRNTALYLVLSIVTIGLFGIFWRYTLMADGNAHFHSDATMEDVIAHGLRGTAPLQLRLPG